MAVWALVVIIAALDRQADPVVVVEVKLPVSVEQQQKALVEQTYMEITEDEVPDKQVAIGKLPAVEAVLAPSVVLLM